MKQIEAEELTWARSMNARLLAGGWLVVYAPADHRLLIRPNDLPLPKSLWDELAARSGAFATFLRWEYDYAHR